MSDPMRFQPCPGCGGLTMGGKRCWSCTAKPRPSDLAYYASDLERQLQYKDTKILELKAKVKKLEEAQESCAQVADACAEKWKGPARVAAKLVAKKIRDRL